MTDDGSDTFDSSSVVGYESHSHHQMETCNLPAGIEGVEAKGSMLYLASARLRIQRCGGFGLFYVCLPMSTVLLRVCYAKLYLIYDYYELYLIYVSYGMPKSCGVAAEPELTVTP